MLNDIRKHPHYSAFLLIVPVWIVFGMTGCQSVTDTLSQVDYACVDVGVDGYFTDSGIQGRGIILPEGKEISQEVINDLCNY